MWSRSGMVIKKKSEAVLGKLTTFPFGIIFCLKLPLLFIHVVIIKIIKSEERNFIINNSLFDKLFGQKDGKTGK